MRRQSHDVRTDRENEDRSAAGFYGKLNAYGRAALSTEKIAYGGTDRKHRLLRSLAAGSHNDLHIEGAEFRDFVAARRPARSTRKFAYGVIRTGIRLLTSVVEPAS